jgi:hypothetical protein
MTITVCTITGWTGRSNHARPSGGVALHDQYGGGRQGGIAPSRRSPNVLTFADPEAGEQHGYFDH